MAVDNFDKKIKKQLEAREINPSSRAWEQLAAQLEVKEEKSTKKYWWLGIAASFLAGILITSLVSNQQVVETIKVVEAHDQIEKEVNSEEEQVAKNNYKTILSNTKTLENQDLTGVETKIVLEPNPPKNARAAHSNEKVKAIKKLPKKELLLITHENIAKKYVIESNSNLAADSLVNQLAQHQNLTAAQEAKLLLDQAKQKVRIRNFNHFDNRISAENLLENIEVEDKQSFKEKVLYALESGFHQVKKSVVK